MADDPTEQTSTDPAPEDQSIPESAPGMDGQLHENGVEEEPLVPGEAISAWIKENQMLALLGSFAVGVFIGVMMRR